MGVIKEEARDHPANRAGRTRDCPSQPRILYAHRRHIRMKLTERETLRNSYLSFRKKSCRVAAAVFHLGQLHVLIRGREREGGKMILVVRRHSNGGESNCSPDRRWIGVRRSRQEGRRRRRGEENKVEWQIVDGSVKYLDAFDDVRSRLLSKNLLLRAAAHRFIFCSDLCKNEALILIAPSLRGWSGLPPVRI